MRHQASGSSQQGEWIPPTTHGHNREPGRSFGRHSGGFATLTVTLPLPTGTVVSGPIPSSSGSTRPMESRALIASFHGTLASTKEDHPGGKTLPRMRRNLGTSVIRRGFIPGRSSAGRALAVNSLPNSQRNGGPLRGCHAHDGRDLNTLFLQRQHYDRSRFHGLLCCRASRSPATIAACTSHLAAQWNPPYQPGPALERQPISSWAAVPTRLARPGYGRVVVLFCQRDARKEDSLNPREIPRA